MHDGKDRSERPSASSPNTPKVLRRFTRSAGRACPSRECRSRRDFSAPPRPGRGFGRSDVHSKRIASPTRYGSPRARRSRSPESRARRGMLSLIEANNIRRFSGPVRYWSHRASAVTTGNKYSRGAQCVEMPHWGILSPVGGADVGEASPFRRTHRGSSRSDVTFGANCLLRPPTRRPWRATRVEGPPRGITTPTVAGDDNPRLSRPKRSAHSKESDPPCPRAGRVKRVNRVEPPSVASSP